MSDALPRLSNDSDGEINIIFKNKFLYGETNRKLRQRLSAMKLKENCLYLIPSPLLGRGLKTLLNQLPESSSILAIEADELLGLMAEQNIETPIRNHRQFHFLHPVSVRKIHDYLSGNNLLLHQSCEVLSLNRGARLNSRVYSEIKRHCETEIKTWWVNRFTVMKLSKSWIKNIIRNLPAVCSSEPVKLEHKPVLIAGAGESLEDSMDYIREQRGHLNVIAVDTALSCFIENDMAPDAVFALEGQFHNIKDFELVAEQGIPVITDLTSHYATHRFSHGHCTFYASEFEQNALSDRLRSAGLLPPEIPPLGSVGVAAVAYAVKCRFPVIFFTGLDFSFVPGKTHARGSSYHRLFLRSGERLRPAGNFRRDNRYRNIRELDRNSMTSDTMLFYARQLNELSESSSIYDLRGRGVPLGYPCISREEAAHIMEAYRNRKAPSGVLKSGSSDRALYLSFVRNEILLIQALLDNWDSIREGRAEFPKECGYLFMHRPEYFKDRDTSLFLDDESGHHVRSIMKEWLNAETSLRQF